MDMKQGTAGQAQEPTINSSSEPKDPQDVALFVSYAVCDASRAQPTLIHFRSCLQVQTLLQQVQDKFQTMSDQILNRIDEMGGRIDELEHNLNELMQQAGVQPPIDDGSSNQNNPTNDSQDAKKQWTVY